MANWVRYPPPFSERFPPWRACEVEVRYPPSQKGYLSNTCAMTYENKANGCDTPLCDTISKGYCAIWGGYLASDIQRKTKGGGNSGEGKTYHTTPPQKRFWPPPLMIRFPPPLCLRNVILLRGNGHRPDKSHFLRLPKLVLEGVLYGTFSLPQNRTIRFAPPLCEFPSTGPLSSWQKDDSDGSGFWISLGSWAILFCGSKAGNGLNTVSVSNTERGDSESACLPKNRTGSERNVLR